jgi:tetratricopeptide (TPR) repeat protein
LSYYEKAEILFEQSNYTKAIEFYKLELELNPEFNYAKTSIGNCYFNLGELELSLKILSDVISDDPEDWFSNYLIVFVYCAMERLDDAFVFAEKTLDLDPEDELSFYAIANVEFQRDNYLPALRHCNSGLGIDPENDAIKELKSRVLISSGENENARKLIDQLLKSDPNNSDAHALKGAIDLNKENYKDAKKHLLTSLSLNPHDQFVKDNLVEVLKANSFFYKRLMKRAFNQYELDLKFSFWTVLRIIFAIKVLPIIIAIVLIYLLINWYFSVWYEVTMLVQKGYKHLLNESKKLRAKVFFISNCILLICFLIAKEFHLKWVWLLFTLIFTALVFFISYFEAEKKSGKLTCLIFSVTVLTLILAPIFNGGLENLFGSVIIAIVGIGLYGITFSLNGVK